MIKFLNTIPVLASSDLARDVAWYEEKTGFQNVADQKGYAIMQRENMEFHLQLHHGTEDDPVMAGVMRIQVQGILPLFEEFVLRGTIGQDKLRMRTDWGTNEFGFYDLNNNAIFIMEDVG
ncbi:glyoxalase/bleomycin resistance/extradiol dioxygenase family protein [Neolewinella aurantiaca]|uniref:Glyoxalase/bleomycin resistance/extradiol dioxygenase family protein n=1 Tax=Neolewinella aurantiaca TaxID=2602767 RepID=A0A5C7FF51_9BACT|nr:glyoxalase/bleomycin resistance/extradiol dioxygenase family protein [Neolewinella aurantiaca]TXF88205.1 glyoxalase/bleomycin resistance/extradiol dioxygenase family protein [Neolewinella aurantiaca]